jgi:SUMO ligase MMS21 Smc5/6 complex component
MNKLMEYQGRQQNSSRSCSCCKNGIESVSHFLIKCPQFEGERREFNKNISAIDKNFHTKPDFTKLKIILQSDEVELKGSTKGQVFRIAREYVSILYKK